MRRTGFSLLVLLTLLYVAGSLLADKLDSTKTATPLSAHAQVVDSSKASDSAKHAVDTIDTDTIFAPEDFAVIESHHRLYPDFLQTDTVKFYKRFQLGDEPIFAEVIRFVPDLKITMKGEKVKTSDTLFNPAVKLRVWITDTLTKKDSLTQESWAFLYGGAPHFSRNAFFAFNLRDFKVSNPKYIKPPERK